MSISVLLILRDILFDFNEDTSLHWSKSLVALGTYF